MPNIGPIELLIILFIALIILGPSRLPDLANALGRSIKEFRKAASDVQEAATVSTGTELRPNTLRERPAPNQTAAPGTSDGPSGSDT